ncbi:hypothetical protein WA026_014328 [Henosepilachna vigintioctopunctata]|uniref:Protein NATD1 n=1 Tax=Henosepilachna vigintioctopunctata TaxID=420089 RepID=A0AAW1UBG8_9CUCU
MSTTFGSCIDQVINNLKNGNICNTGSSFKIKLNESQYAEVLYEKKGHIYDLQHTSIPEDYQGKGLGSIVAERVFHHLIDADKDVKIKLTCEYLQHYQNKNKNKYDLYITQ